MLHRKNYVAMHHFCSYMSFKRQIAPLTNLEIDPMSKKSKFEANSEMPSEALEMPKEALEFAQKSVDQAQVAFEKVKDVAQDNVTGI